MPFVVAWIVRLSLFTATAAPIAMSVASSDFPRSIRIEAAPASASIDVPSSAVISIGAAVAARERAVRHRHLDRAGDRC